VNGQRTSFHAVGDLGIWRFTMAAPCQLWSANDAHRSDKYKTAVVRKKWRTLTYDTLVGLALPTGLARVAFSVVLHPVIDNRRDALNYADTAKPIIDAFGPPFVQKPTPKKPSGAYAPGYSLIADDTPQYVEDINLSFGDLWQDIITAPGWRLTPDDLSALDNKWGGVSVVVAERPPLPDRPKRKRVPLDRLIPAEVRRRVAVEAMGL